MADELNQENEDLQRENAKLQRENEQLKAILKAEGRAGLWLTKLGFRLFLGSGLTQSIGAWRKAAREQKGIPDEETDELIAAILRRFMLRIGVAALVAIVPTVLTLFLLTRQNNLIESQVVQQATVAAEQNALIQTQVEQQATVAAEQNTLTQGQIEQQATVAAEQNNLVQEQIQQQAQLNDINRRAQLLATLYDRTDCEAENKEDCPLRASLRARAEAAMAFVEIERIAGRKPNLSNLDFSQADFSGLVLTQTVLASANLISTTLRDADLGGANLFNADLGGANLFNADLGGAYLGYADLGGANLGGADLDYADLGGANLRSANLRGADLRSAFLERADLHSADLRSAIYNTQRFIDEYGAERQPTRWPTDFDPKAAGAIDVSEQGDE